MFKIEMQLIEVRPNGDEIAISGTYEIEFKERSEAIAALHTAKDTLTIRALIEPVTGSDHGRD